MTHLVDGIFRERPDGVQVGIPDNQLSIISYGKDRPVCQEHDETCWQKNRRIHLVAMASR